jgi:CheY-like chemotaxis protein/anti-sigma regulatory factor (Ser/Thr protein kinase)
MEALGILLRHMDRTVLLVDDVPELRSVLRQSLRLRGGFTVVAEADDGASAIIAAARHQPEVIVLDLGLPDLAGHEVLTRLRAVSPGAQIVVYTGSVSPDRVSFMEEVEAFVTKDQDVGYLADLLTRLGRQRYETDRVQLGPAASDVAVARRFVAERCRDWGCGDVVEDAELVVSELVTNALVHGESRCELRAGLSEAALRLQVIDDGAGMPDPQAATDTDEHGRGLLLVSALSTAWGVELLPDGGKIVWAELLRPLQEPVDDDPGPDEGGGQAETPGVAGRKRPGPGATEAPGRFGGSEAQQGRVAGAGAR